MGRGAGAAIALVVGAVEILDLRIALIEVKVKVAAAIGADQQAGKHIVFSIVGATLTDFAPLLLHLLIHSTLDDRLMDVLEHHPILAVIVDSLLILVPEIPDGSRRGGKEEFDGADGQPEYAQRRRRRQIPPHLRLDNALPERNATPRRKPNINEAPQQRHRQKIHSTPLARFSGIGIAMHDPIWYAGQEENWKNRGLGKEWAA